SNFISFFPSLCFLLPFVFFFKPAASRIARYLPGNLSCLFHGKADGVFGTGSGNSLPKLGGRAESRQERYNYEPLAVHPLSGLRRIILKFNILRSNSENCLKQVIFCANSPEYKR